MDPSKSHRSLGETSCGLSDIPQARSSIPRKRNRSTRHDEEACVCTEDLSTHTAKVSQPREGRLETSSSTLLHHLPSYDNQIQADLDPYPLHFGPSMHYPFGTDPVGRPPSSPVAQATADLQIFSNNLERLTSDQGHRVDGSVEHMDMTFESAGIQGEADNRSFDERLEQIPSDYCYSLRRFVHEQLVDPYDTSHLCPWEFRGYHCRSGIKSFDSSSMFDPDVEMEETQARSPQELAMVGSFQEDFVLFQDIPESVDLDDDTALADNAELDNIAGPYFNADH